MKNIANAAGRRPCRRESGQLRAPTYRSIRERRGEESYVVIPGSGTGELQGLRGEGTSAVGHGTEHPLTLNYELG